MKVSIHGDALFGKVLAKEFIDYGFFVVNDDSEADAHVLSYTPTQHKEVIERIISIQSDDSTIFVNASTFGIGYTKIMEKYKPDAMWIYIPDCVCEGQDKFEMEVLSVGRDFTHQPTKQMYHIMRSIYKDPFKVNFMPTKDAELGKLALSSMLALRIAFINDMAKLSDRYGIDVENVRRTVADDSRINSPYMYPGAGFGGENFVNDIKLLIKSNGSPGIMDYVWDANESQKDELFKKFWVHNNGKLADKKVMILGAAFKPNTHRTNNSPVHSLIRSLLAYGVTVNIHDPMAADEIKMQYGDHVNFYPDMYDGMVDCDAIFINTDWEDYDSLDFSTIHLTIREAVLIDGRNMYDPTTVAESNFVYYGIGRKS